MTSKHSIKPEPEFRTRTYKHYKGGTYEAVGLALHEETFEWYVMYRPLYEHHGMPNMWLRRLTDFTDTVSYEGATVPRFTFLDTGII